MHLHLRIEDAFSGPIEIDLRAGVIDCVRRWYDEVGGEAFGADRHRWRRPLAPETLDELRRLLPTGDLPRPSHVGLGLDGTTFTLTIGRGVDAVEYSWWVRAPREWDRLRQIVRLLVAAAGVADRVEVL